MYVIIAPIQIKEGYKEQFIEEMIGDAVGSVNDEPGCIRFDVIQDAEDPNRIWLYEVYVRRGGFRGAHAGATLREVEGRHGGLARGLRSPGRGTRRVQHLAAGRPRSVEVAASPPQAHPM